MDQIAFLKQTELLAGLSDARVRQIRETMHEVRAQAGATLFRKGEAGDAVYLLVEGALRLESDGVMLHTCRPGAWVGEIALIDNGPRSATAIIQADALLLSWERESFLRLISQRADVAVGIFKILAGKLRRDTEARVDLVLEQERWRQDLKRAREIQMGMLPPGDLASAHLEISGYCRPAAEVGGDYYDYVDFGGDKLGMIIGDVTGHGFYAGLWVAMAKSCLNTQAEIDHAPRKIMEAMRRTLTISMQRSLLMTCCYVLFEFDQGRLTYANAGHPYPYHYRRKTNRLEKLPPLDPLLGVQDLYNSDFHQDERPWEEGDLLLMYSDGITETRDFNGRMFGHARLEECVLENHDRSAAQIKEAILDRLNCHCESGSFDDDLTLAVARAL